MMIDKQTFIDESLEIYKSWLIPIDEAQPCGEDLSDNQEYLELKTMCEPAISGFASQEAKPVQWPSVLQKTNKLLEKTKDINVLMWHCRAALNSDGLVGFARALTATIATIDTLWDTIHPQLDPEDEENDPFERVLALKSVGEINGTLNDLINSVLVKDKQGEKFVLSTILNENHHIIQSGIDSDFAPIINALDEPGKLNFAAANKVVSQFINDTNTLFEKHTNNNNLFHLEKFEHYAGLIDKLIKNVIIETTDELDQIESGSSDGDVAPVVKKTGVVENRNDVEKMLDLIIAYYQKEEPSSPMPFLLQRAKSLVNKDFIEIITELSPGGANEARSICGLDKS